MTTSKREAALTMRADFLHRVRLNHLLNACSMVHYGLDGSHWVGDDTRGMFVAVNNADHQMIAWNAEGFVAVAWDDHEPPLVYGPGGRHVLTALLGQLPPSLKPLLKELTKSTNSQPPTSLRWLEVTEAGHKVGGDGLRSDQLNAYDQPLETLLAGWRMLYSLSEAQAALALELAASGSGARHTLSAAEEETLLAPPEPLDQQPLVPAQVGRAAAMLKQVGVDWPAAEEHAAARARDDSDHGLALLAAVEAGNHAEVKALVAKGANWRKQPEGHASLPRHALNAAAGSGHSAMLELILNHAGEAVTKHELSVALMAAVNTGSRALADVLLARGAEKEETLVFQAISSGRPEAIAIAIDLGVTPRMAPFWFENLRKVCLDGNRPDVLARYPGSAEMAARVEQLANAQIAARRAQYSNVLFHVRMRHLTHAVRNLKSKRSEVSRYEGTAERGRYVYAANDMQKHVVAWNAHGLVLWTSGGPGPKLTVLAAFESAPPALQALAMETATWPHADANVREWYWVFPSASDPDAITRSNARLGSIVASFTATSTNRQNWPAEAQKLAPNVASQIAHVIQLSMQGPYELTSLDLDWLMDGSIRKGALSEAVELAAQLGIRWPQR